MRCRNLLLSLTTLFCLLHATSGVAADREFRFSSYQQVLDLFEELGYTPEAWQAGIHSIPRVYLANVPERWRGTVSGEVSVILKKRIFFRAIAPLALRSNELILEDRERLIDLRERSGVAGEDLSWLKSLAIRYRVIDEEGEAMNEVVLAELLSRVDIVPVSLALAQAAEESGWGTSRFSDLGNALFGQWTWGDQGIAPTEQRTGLGNYKIASFDTPLGSIQGYMHNLNTNQAYADLREKRSSMRAAGETLSGWHLAEALTRYSERGEKYVKSLRAIMRVNKLSPADRAYLQEGPSIILVPVGEGAQ